MKDGHDADFWKGFLILLLAEKLMTNKMHCKNFWGTGLPSFIKPDQKKIRLDKLKNFFSIVVIKLKIDSHMFGIYVKIRLGLAASHIKDKSILFEK